MKRMAIVENQKVKVKWNNANKKHYQSFGYIFTKSGDEFEIKINHITKGSKVKVKFECDWCNEKYDRAYSTGIRYEHHFCSNECQHKYRSHYAEINKPTKQCEGCGEVYKVEKYNYETSRFCSNECLTKWQSKAFKGENSPLYVERFTVNCDWCGEEIQRTQNKLDTRSYHFCNRTCQQSWHKNVYVKSDEFIEIAKKTMLSNLSEGKIKFTETEPHLKITQILDGLGLKYKNEEIVSDYSFDIYLEDFDLYIEINGGFWHCDNRLYSEINYTHQLDRVIKDKRKRTYLFNNLKKRILYLWEQDINNNIETCIELITEYIKSNGNLKNFHSMNYFVLDGKLALNKVLLLPYMDRNFNDIASIVNLEVRKKVTRYDETKHVIFNCEYCNEEKTQLIIVYMKAKNHFCSVKCKNLSQQVGNDTGNLKHEYDCDNCGKPMEVKNYIIQDLKNGKRKSITCSRECQHEFQSKNNKGKDNPLYSRIMRECEYCGSEYEIPQNQKERSHFCSVECRQKGLRNRIIVKCLNCGVDVEKTPTDIKKNKTGQYFCSHTCHNEYKVESNREIRDCEYEHCNNTFTVKKNSKQRFCCVPCRNKAITRKAA